LRMEIEPEIDLGRKGGYLFYFPIHGITRSLDRLGPLDLFHQRD
jgi:hypothetical protein